MIRITAGEFKGRNLQTPEGQSTRPTLAKLRQALFNSIQFQIPGSRVLDLFSGSGSLGFEALSRGADFVLFYESGAKAANAVLQNQQALGVEDRTRLVQKSVTSIWENPESIVIPSGGFQFDFVFADPPYEEGWELKLVEKMPWAKLLKPDGTFIVEWSDRKVQLPDETEFLKKTREKEYGDSVLTHYEMKDL